jgi:hypothetical protein
MGTPQRASYDASTPFDYNYNGDYSEIKSMADAHRRAYANAIAATPTLAVAAFELGVHVRSINRYIADEGLKGSEIDKMRMDFLMKDVKIKSRRDAYTKSESKSSESQERPPMVQE